MRMYIDFRLLWLQEKKIQLIPVYRPPFKMVLFFFFLQLFQYTNLINHILKKVLKTIRYRYKFVRLIFNTPKNFRTNLGSIGSFRAHAYECGYKCTYNK